MHRNALVRAGLCVLGSVAGLVSLASGCDSSKGTGDVATPAKEHAKHNQEMLDFMKNQGKGATPAR
jgi:hypothetical protein